MAEDITFTDSKSKSKECQQIQFISQRFNPNFRMTNRLINGHPLYFDADADDNKRGVDVEYGNQNQLRSKQWTQREQRVTE